MSQPLKVLLVEDNRIEARQTQQWLANAKDSSFEVEWVERMRFALERLSRGGIDIVLLDLNLPDSVPDLSGKEPSGVVVFRKSHPTLVPASFRGGLSLIDTTGVGEQMFPIGPGLFPVNRERFPRARGVS